MAKRRLSSNGEVIGVGVTKTEGGYAVKVILRELPAGSIPTEVDGVPLVVDTVGVLRKRRR